MKKLQVLRMGLLLGAAWCGAVAQAGVTTNDVFRDDFEAGLGNWAVHPGASTLDDSTAQNIVPPGGAHSAQLNSSLDKMYHLLTPEVTGASVATFYIYDGPSTRAFGEIRAHSGPYNVGVQNVFAIGKYNSSTRPGEPFDGTKYQGRAGFTTNSTIYWFNLNAPGAPSRSAGWHRFDIVRGTNASTYNFYVDGILSRNLEMVADFPWDTVTMGSVAAGSTAGDAWFDGISVGTITEIPPRPPSFFRKNFLPPPDGMYTASQGWSALYANGVKLSNVIHKQFTASIEPPPPGMTVTHPFGSTMHLEVAPGPGLPFQPHIVPAEVTVRITRRPDPGLEEVYATEMLQLDLQGGSLPPEVRVRVNPMRPSLGETRIRPVSGGYMISSFFDIFTEVSTDAGMTWSPSPEPCRVELTMDPTTVPPADAPTALLPPLVHEYAAPPGFLVAFPDGLVVTDLRQTIFSSAVLPPPFGQRVSHTFDSQVDMVVQTGMGAPMRLRAPATMTVDMLHAPDFMDTQYLETEAVQLDITGGDLPPGFRLRESPTLPSRGGTSLSGGGGGGGGGSRISSFFDIFVELSTDGGTSWSLPLSGPMRLQLETLAPPAEFPTDDLLPSGGEYAGSGGNFADYSHLLVGECTLGRLTPSAPPPPPGGSVNHNFTGEVLLTTSTDGGLTWARRIAPAEGRVNIRSQQDQMNTRYFDVEMVELRIVGGELPPGLIIRESPTRASTGRTSSSLLPDGRYRVDSFFDVFTELSLDGGTIWQPSLTGPGTLVLRRSACESPAIAEPPADTAVECTFNAVFRVLARGTEPLHYEWRANGVPLPSTVPQGPELVFGPCTLADDGKRFDVVVWNDCGSITSEVAVLRVTDTIPPVVTLPLDLVVPTDPGLCSAVVRYLLPEAFDTCSSVTVICEPGPGETFPLGPTPVRCTATDTSGNSTPATFLVIVKDSEPPTMTCPPPELTLPVDPGTCRAPLPDLRPPDVADNCPGVAFVQTPEAGTLLGLGDTRVTLRAVDAAQNETTCTVLVHVIDPVTELSLAIAQLGAEVVISWPVTCSTWWLQEANHLGPAPMDWQFNEETPVQSGGFWQVTVTTEDARFYRLVRAEPQVSRVSFGQLDWHDTDGQLLVPDSSWGDFAADIVPHPTEITYVNVMADAGHGPAWVIQNLPVFPRTVGNGAYRQGCDFNIAALGLPEGQNLASLVYWVCLDATIQSNLPACGPPTSTTVENVRRISGGSKLPSDPLGPSAGQPAGIMLQVVPTNVIQLSFVEGVQEETNACLAGALARSIRELIRQHKLTNNIGTNKTAQGIYNDLRALKVGSSGTNATSYEEDIAAKAKYLKDLAAANGKTGTTKILDKDNLVGPVNGVNEETAPDLKDWLTQELAKGPVELHYDKHIVTVSAIYESGGKTYIKYRDDETQGDDKKGDEKEKTAELKKEGGDWQFRRSDAHPFFKVKVAIAESVT